MHFSSRKMLIEWQRTENFGEWLDTTPLWVKTSDEFELKFPKLSRAKLKRCQAKSSGAGAFQ